LEIQKFDKWIEIPVGERTGLASGIGLVGMNFDPQGWGSVFGIVSELELGGLEIRKFDECFEIPVGEQ
jgi:hypothetical protein